MTLTQIQNLTLNGSFYAVLDGLVDFTLVPEGEGTYSFLEEEGPLYDRLILNVMFTKPTLEEMEAELLVYKAELTTKEEARLAEESRKQGLRDRFNVLKDEDSGMPGFYQLISGIPNAATYFRDQIFNEEDHVLAESRMKAIEDKDTEIKTAAKATEYVTLRRTEYPSTDDLIVALWEGNQTEIDALEAKRQAVKTKYPKA